VHLSIVSLAAIEVRVVAEKLEALTVLGLFNSRIKDCYDLALLTQHVTIMVVRVVQGQYEDGALRPTERLGLRPGEQVSLIVVRRPDPSRWDLARLANTASGEDAGLAEQGLAEWAGELDATERT
jgi:predicted DNA-binding antitoxin AbrB/MazE fold protein